MNRNPEPKKPTKAARPDKPAAAQQPATIEAEMESAAAEAEPMGSIAAAVPGSNAAAQDAMRTGKSPGAESPQVENTAEATAGTEVKREGEGPEPG